MKTWQDIEELISKMTKYEIEKLFKMIKQKRKELKEE